MTETRGRAYSPEVISLRVILPDGESRNAFTRKESGNLQSTSMPVYHSDSFPIAELPEVTFATAEEYCCLRRVCDKLDEASRTLRKDSESKPLIVRRPCARTLIYAACSGIMANRQSETRMDSGMNPELNDYTYLEQRRQIEVLDSGSVNNALTRVNAMSEQSPSLND